MPTYAPRSPRSGLVIFWIATNFTVTQIFERLARQTSSVVAHGLSPVQYYAISIAVMGARGRRRLPCVIN